ncbi:unnamed protein product, partial [Laminaria digitata]
MEVHESLTATSFHGKFHLLPSTSTESSIYFHLLPCKYSFHLISWKLPSTSMEASTKFHPFPSTFLFFQSAVDFHDIIYLQRNFHLLPIHFHLLPIYLHLFHDSSCILGSDKPIIEPSHATASKHRSP